MMNKIKFLGDLSLAPVYFLLVLTHGIVQAFKNACRDTMDAIRETKRLYGMAPTGNKAKMAKRMAGENLFR
jgi:hypothetical protein